MLNLKELSLANPNTFGHGFEKHYLLQIYNIPDQWGIWVNIKLYSSEKSAAVPAMLWRNYSCIHVMVLWGFRMLSFTRCLKHTGTRHAALPEIQATGLLVWSFHLHDVQQCCHEKCKFYFILWLFWEDATGRSTAVERNLDDGPVLLLPLVGKPCS